jgi:hypothetical protein
LEGRVSAATHALFLLRESTCMEGTILLEMW